MGKRLNALICGKFGKRAAYIIHVSTQTVRKERRVFNIAKQNIYNANIFDIYKFRKISTRPCGISLSALSRPFYAFCAFLFFLRFFILLLSIYTVPHIIAALRSALVSHWVFLRFLSPPATAKSVVSSFCCSVKCIYYIYTLI